MATQRYVANELTHFAGRGQATPEVQFEILVKILATGALLAAPSDGTADPGGGWRSVSGSPLCGDRYRTGVVCFCDIPAQDLPLHVSKYSPFGIAYSKPFMVSKGASPVFYVAMNAPAVTKPPMSREAYFNEMIELWDRALKVKFMNPIQGALQGISVPRPGEPSRSLAADEVPVLIQAMNDMQHYFGLAEFIERHIFCYMKCFDASLPDDHLNNFYMEREWRIIGNVSFQMSDVTRLFMPRRFAASFRDRFPEYNGELYFSES